MTDLDMTDPTWWEPPLAGTEAEQVVGALDRLRATFRWKTGGLDAAGLRTGTAIRASRSRGCSSTSPPRRTTPPP